MTALTISVQQGVTVDYTCQRRWSSLQTLPDPFDETTHQKLDEAVNEIAETHLPPADDSERPTVPYHVFHPLLHHIIDNSNGLLDRKYVLGKENAKLIKENEGLRDLLSTAWGKKSYREIRNLAILRAAPKAQEGPMSSAKPNDDNLSDSFKGTYRGAAVHGFYEHLTYIERLFDDSTEKHYAKFCSIVQSSGTGKSRLLTELGLNKDVIIIYLNLRDSKDNTGFPPRDQIAADILTDKDKSKKDYTAVCYAFFIALFNTVEVIIKILANPFAREYCAGRELCVTCPILRQDFFEKLDENYKKSHGALIGAAQQAAWETTQASSTPKEDNTGVKITGEDVDNTNRRSKDRSVSEPNVEDNQVGASEFNKLLRDSYERMTKSLAHCFDWERSTEPELVVAIDEAHSLTEGFACRPADVLCRVVKQYSHYNENGRHAVWVAFASTTSKVADFSPPNKLCNSARVTLDGEELFPPYTQLGWDQSATAFGRAGVEYISQAMHIAGYGRPLYDSLPSFLLRAKLNDPIEGVSPSFVLNLASQKLRGSKEYKASDIDQVLAVLGQRFAVDVTFRHPDAVKYLEKGVASHLRICFATTIDRNWRFTGYPSEPFLSCVAAHVLHANADYLGTSLNELLNFVNRGMVDMGQRGELASRFLWLLAKDLFVRKKSGSNAFPTKWNGDLIDCQTISVAGWLEFVFGPQVLEADQCDKEVIKEAFKDAHLNFSHWVCMDTYLSGTDDKEELSLDEFTSRHFKRTSAVQCCHQQPLVDKMIPLYFSDKRNTSTEGHMSQIFIQDKARVSESKDALRSITRRSPSLGGQNDGLPYIAILADLGQPPSFSVTFPMSEDVEDRYLRIYAAGVSTKTFPFLERNGSLVDALKRFVQLRKVPETEKFYAKYLNAQVKFGSSPTPTHMKREHGKTAGITGSSRSGPRLVLG